ncbi:MAG TPA: thiamine phosphate synthase [Solirubrobacteraceae bacterium]|nr:thiamine phosphate synthase [Solirubrobacteraceae bacterium]
MHDRLAAARLYLVCDEPDDAFLEAALDGGVQIVQLRCKHASEEQILAAAARVRAACRRHGALAILNDRPDLARRAGLDGVHVGQDDLPVAQARAIVGREAIVGLSTHSPAQIEAAEGIDYIGVGPVHATPTKPGRPAVGLELVRYAAAHARVPFFAIGGINPENAGAVVTAGAERLAVVRAITGAADPAGVARTLRDALEVGVGAT